MNNIDVSHVTMTGGGLSLTLLSPKMVCFREGLLEDAKRLGDRRTALIHHRCTRAQSEVARKHCGG